MASLGSCSSIELVDNLCSTSSRNMNCSYSLWVNWGKANTDIWGYPPKTAGLPGFSRENFWTCKENQRLAFIWGYHLTWKGKESLKQTTGSSTITLSWKHKNLLQWDWYIREQFEQNMNFAFDYEQFHLWETLGEHRKLHPEYMKYTNLKQLASYLRSPCVLWAITIHIWYYTFLLFSDNLPSNTSQ